MAWASSTHNLQQRHVKVFLNKTVQAFVVSPVDVLHIFWFRATCRPTLERVSNQGPLLEKKQDHGRVHLMERRAGSGMGGSGADRGFVHTPFAVCFHTYALTIKWEGPVADCYWSCRRWQRRVGPSNRLCLNLRICSSSCLHNEV